VTKIQAQRERRPHPLRPFDEWEARQREDRPGYVVCSVCGLNATRCRSARYAQACAALATIEVAPLPTAIVVWRPLPRLGIWARFKASAPARRERRAELAELNRALIAEMTKGLLEALRAVLWRIRRK
jgi:hypothetical protein